MDKSPETCSPSVISYAAAMRVKYRKTNADGKAVKRTLAIGSMGVHPQNRGGLYPAGCRCKGLLESVLDVGVSKEDVNSCVVVVEETRSAVAEETPHQSLPSNDTCAVSDGTTTCGNTIIN